MIFDFEKIHRLQIDITSYCNSFCGGCARNIEGGEVNPNLKLNHLSEENWYKLITEKNLLYVDSITFNGNFGDFGMHPQGVEFLEYLYNVKKNVSIRIHTNGGMQKTDYWMSLGEQLKKFKDHTLIFSIDGVSHNAARYRRGTDFEEIIQNAKAVISTGANVNWRYVVFDHNIEDVPQAHEMAKNLGFSAFLLNRSYNREIKMKKYKSFNDDFITAPDREKVLELSKKYSFDLKEDDVDEKKDIITQHKKNVQKINSDIKKNICPWDKEKRIQIDFQGNIWPCCYISYTPYVKNKKTLLEINLLKTIESYGDFNNIGKHTLEDILNHNFFKKDLLTAWNNNSFGVCNSCLDKTSPPTS